MMLWLAGLAWSKPSGAGYVRAEGRPLNIAHRGLAAVFPENTLQSLSAAMYMGADFVEFDICYTKQMVPLIMHDPYLSRITDVASRPEFLDRQHRRVFEGKNVTDWWTDNFTLQELLTLHIKQDQAPGRITTLDYFFSFPTLYDIIEYGLAFNLQHQGARNPDGRLVGLLIEAKSSEMYRELYGYEIGATILSVLRKYKLDSVDSCTKRLPIYLHSFDFQTVKFWSATTDLPVSFLYSSGSQAKVNLAEVAQFACSVGVNDLVEWDYKQNKSRGMVDQAHSLGLLVHMWTFKDDMLFFNSSTGVQAYRLGKSLQLDGIITEFTDTLATVQRLI